MNKTAFFCSLTALTLFLTAACTQRLDFDVTFKDAHNLHSGDPVIYRGAKIGEVMSIEVDGHTVRVGVRVDRNRRALVYREAAYVIENPDGYFASTPRRQITVKDRGTARSQVQQADVVEGTEPVVDQIREHAVPIIDAIQKRLIP